MELDNLKLDVEERSFIIPPEKQVVEKTATPATDIRTKAAGGKTNG